MSTDRQYRVRKSAYTRSMGSAMITQSVQFDDNESMFIKFSSIAPLFAQLLQKNLPVWEYSSCS